MNIYILTEISKRELDSNILLALVAAQNGNSVLISNMDTIEYLANKKLISKGIFHTKSILHDERKQNLHLNLYNSGFKITSIDEENGLVDKKLDFFCSVRFSEESLKLASKIFCWGNDDYNNLIKYYKNSKKKFIKSGAPRIDLWKKIFIPYWISHKEKKRNKVLISLNFQLINGFETLKTKIKKLELANYFKRSNAYKKEILDISKQNKKDLRNFKDLINYLSNNFKDILFVVRPHPSEKVSTWKQILNEKKNIIIKNDENFNAELADSDLLIQNGCTTAFQAAMYDIPIISYVVQNKLKNHGVVANKLGYQISSKEDVKKSIKDYFFNKKNLKVKTKKILSKKLFLYKNELSCHKIFKEWKKINYSKIVVKNNWKLIRFRLFFFDLKNLLKTDNKFKNFTSSQISDKVAKFKDILNIKENFNVIKISKKSFLIEKKK